MKERVEEKNGEEEECSQNRVEFHKMLSLLIRMGCGDKQIQERANPRRIVSMRFRSENGGQKKNGKRDFLKTKNLHISTKHF